jgi:hypothetical protein
VLADAPCPVLLEWDMTAPVNRARTQPVCCAVESGAGEQNVLQEAVRAAAHMDAPLKVVCPLVPGASRIELWDCATRERQVAALRSRLEEVCGHWAPEAEVHVDVGPAASVISRAIRFHGAGLLVTGGSRESVLAAEAECPVLYVGPARRHRAGRPEALHFAAGRSA